MNPAWTICHNLMNKSRHELYKNTFKEIGVGISSFVEQDTVRLLEIRRAAYALITSKKGQQTNFTYIH